MSIFVAVVKTKFFPVVRRLFVVAALVLMAIALVLFVIQEKMLFYPRSYPPHDAPPQGFRPVPYVISQGSQVAWWYGPAQTENWWIVFNGNGSVAWDWADLFARSAPATAGFLVVDWPGFGYSQGKPGRSAIAESASQAVAAAREHGLLPSSQHRPGIMGHSMGTGAALDFAAVNKTRGVILAAPYTDLLTMAQRTVGWPLCHVLRHRFDNRARLQEIRQFPDRPWVQIVHGERDNIIPYSMGETLAADHPDWIHYRRMPNTGHALLFEFYPEFFTQLISR